MAKENENRSGLSIAKGLFLGEVRDDVLSPFPVIKPDEQETVRMVIESIDRFMAEKDKEYRQFDEEGVQPQEYVDELKTLGLFSLIIPTEYEGLGLSNSAYSRVLQQTSRYDASTSLTVGAHSSIGLKALLLFGTDAQKAKYLPKLATGEMIAAFCLTESGSGSDAASIKTRATKMADGSWSLTGEKIWITNGGTAEFFTVFAATESDGGKITAFIVERSFAGVSSGPKEDKMGIRASCTTTVRFDNVKVPAECVLGEEGKGFKVAMAVLNNGRTGLGGGCVGAMKRLIELASAQATQRKQFGKSISEFQLIKEKIGLMTMLCFASESVVSVVGHLIDSGAEDFSVEAAMSKVFVSEALWTVADEALQVAGGNGFMKEFPYERVVRDSRINRIFEGTNEILRLFVGLSGMKDAGDELKDVARSLSGIFNHPIKGFGVLSGYASKKISQYTPLGRQTLSNVHASLAKEAGVVEQDISRLASSVESALRAHGKGIIGQQLVTKRLADTAMELFVAMCVLVRVSSIIQAKGVSGAETEIRLAKAFIHRVNHHIDGHLKTLFENADKELCAVADATLEAGRFVWDVV
jgi:alkylation response protein AidB-like acyl-CoA dehydrogenase